MPKPKVYIFGAGHVGIGFAQALQNHGYHVLGVWTRGASRARAAKKILRIPIDVGVFAKEKIVCADILLLCVADSALPGFSKNLPGYKKGAVLLHTSGALPSTILGDRPGLHRGSLHPLASFPNPQDAARNLLGCHFIWEGNTHAQRVIKTMIKKLRSHGVGISTRNKARYHAAAVLSSNLVVALLEVALDEAQKAGLENPPRLLLPMARATLRTIEKVGTARALTGPIQRGDLITIQHHLRALVGTHRDAYKQLSLVALQLAQKQRGTLANDRLLLKLLS